jgi:hypothetical protein
VISDWSVSLWPLVKSGWVQTSPPPVRRCATMSIGSALSVMATYAPVIVGVVPDPTSVWPGFEVPSFG